MGEFFFLVFLCPNPPSKKYENTIICKQFAQFQYTPFSTLGSISYIFWLLNTFFRRVYKACHKKSGRLCALKVVFSIEEEDGV